MGWFSNLVSARTTTASKPAQWFINLIGGGPTGSGEIINADNAMRITAVLQAVRILAESSASLPLKLYQRNGNNKHEATDHPAYQLVYSSPNESMTSFDWREAQMVALGLRGNAYSLVKRDHQGALGELILLHPDKTKVVMSQSGKLFYESMETNKTHPARHILHQKGLSTNGLMGLNPIEMTREALGLSVAAEKHGATTFKNGATPTGILVTPDKAKPEQINELKKSWKKENGGNNKNGVAVLHSGIKYQQISVSNADAQFLETRKFQIAEIARIFNVPVHLLHDMDRSTFNNIEHMSLAFIKFSLRPWLIRMEQRLNLSLLRPEERHHYYFEHNLSALERADIKTRFSVYAQGRQWGIYSANDCRRKETETLRDDDEGDSYHTPLNMMDQDAINDAKDASNEPSKETGHDE
ncbi:phage portal protein [Pleionea sediminis]|uniref:phage portal protein n=1 Tax=Pleionea sediminis TaxID=2569479 RepID=UPI001185C7F0|nr:phage portal protein [Pleionea sediminis]